MSSLQSLIPENLRTQQRIPLKCKILIDNVGIGTEEYITLIQGFNQHHTFIIKGKIENFKPDGDISLQWLEDIRNFIGKYITIQFENQTYTQSNDFAGIVTHVNILQQADYLNTYIIEGYSKTWVLENGPSYRMYQNRSIHNIITDINSKNKGSLKIECDAINNSDLNIEHALISQYAETDFHFLNRIALAYGHRFYYDQSSLYFGKPKKSDPSIPLIFRKNLYNYEANHQLKTNNNQVLNHYFNNDNSNYKNAVWPKLTKEQYGQHAVYNIAETNKWLKATSQHIAPIQDDSQGSIEQYQKKQQAQTASEAYVLHCQTTEYTLHPGSIITIQRPLETNGEPKLLGEYIVQHITHEYSFIDGLYYNTLIAIPNTTEAFPHNTQYIQPIQAQPQLAEVISTTPDLQQKVQVRFHWSTDDYYSPWLRVAQPNWGSNEKGDGRRGFYFLPSKGDLVCANFLHGNPNFPYISHSIPHGKNIAGSDNTNNYLRHISTPIGHTIVFNDNPENPSISVIDNNGNSISINSKESKIYITGQKGVIIKGDEILLESKNTRITSTEKLTIKADTQLKIQSQEKLIIEGGERLDLKADNLKIEARKELKELGNAVNIAAKDCLSIYGQTLNAHGQCGLNLKSPQLNKDTNPAIIEANFTKPPEDLQFVVLFYPDMETYDGGFGIDWLKCDDNGNIDEIQGTEIYKLTSVFDYANNEFLYVLLNRDILNRLRAAEYLCERFYKYQYVVPYLSMLPKPEKEIKLKMKIHFLNKDIKPNPQKDYLKVAKNEYYEVVINGQTDNQKYIPIADGVETSISIKCKKAGPEQILKFLDETGERVGEIKVVDNTKILNLPIYVVPVIIDGPEKKEYISGLIQDFTNAKIEDVLNKKSFNQALVQFKIQTNPQWHLAFKEEEWEKAGYYDILTKTFIDKNFTDTAIGFAKREFLKTIPDKQKFDTGIIIFITAHEEHANNYTLGSAAFPFMGLNCTMIYGPGLKNGPEQTADTIQHEIGHLLGLTHTFDIDIWFQETKKQQDNYQKNIDKKKEDINKLNTSIEQEKIKNDKYNKKHQGKDSAVALANIEQANKQIEKLNKEIGEAKKQLIDTENLLVMFKNNKYGFIKRTTHNIMDYSESEVNLLGYIQKQDKRKRNMFFKWQWDIIRAEAEKYHNNTTEQNKIK